MTMRFPNQMVALILLYANSLYIVRVHGLEPEPYPPHFSIQFSTNVTNEDWTHPIDGTLFYDWKLKRQRIDHSSGSFECVHFYSTSGPCSLLFTETGMYRFVITAESNRQEPDCCLDLEGVGVPPPDWASRANGTFQGLVYDVYSGRLAYQWTFNQLVGSYPIKDPTLPSDFHTTRQVADGFYSGYPLTFGFPHNEGQDYHYRVQTLKLGRPPQTLFDLPNGCEHRKCRTRYGSYPN